MDLSLKELIRIARRWWWLLLLAPLVGAASAFYVSDRQVPLYSASATIQVNPPQSQNSAVDFSALQGTQRLAETYRQVIQTRTVLEPLVGTLALPYDVSELQGKVSASTVSNTQLIRVSVSDPDPAQAAYLANAIAQRFVEYSNEQQTALSSPYRAEIDQQLQQTREQIASVQEQIAAIETGPNPTSAESRAQLQDLNITLNQLQSTYSDLLGTANSVTLAQAANQTLVTVAEQAIPPKSPYAPKTELYTVLGAFVGLCIAIGGVALLEYLDNTVKPAPNFERTFGVPMLSVLTRGANVKPGHDQVFVLNDPHSSLAESVRLLRTNLEFAAATADIQSLSVTSSSPGDGKSTVAANLAVSMAQSGFVTILVDADLRRPTQHKVFELRNDRGLTNLLTHPSQEWKEVANQVGHPNLWVLTSGPVPPNPADLLSSNRLPALVKHLEQEADVVVFDTPPILAVSDPLIVATQVDGVLLVASSGTTRIDALQRALDALPDESVRTLGIVLNKHVARASADYYYAYSYYGAGDKPPAPAPVPSTERSAPLSP